MQYIYIYIYFGGGGLGGGRDYFFLGLKSYFLKYKRNIRVESPISENIRKFCYARILNILCLKHKKAPFPEI